MYLEIIIFQGENALFVPKCILTLISLEFQMQGHHRNKEHLKRCVVTHGAKKETQLRFCRGELSTIYLGCPEQACGHRTVDTTSK